MFSQKSQSVFMVLASFSIAFLAIFLFSPKEVFAQVVLNKFSSNDGTDWVEVYNNSSESVDLAGGNYCLKDTSSSGNKKDLGCFLPSGERYSVDWGGNLNNNGDRIHLYKGETIVDCVAYGDGNGTICDGRSSVDLTKLEAGEYAIRSPEGSGSWIKTGDSAHAGSSSCLSMTSTPTSATAMEADPSDIELSEFMPDDNDGNEWVEIKNNASSEVALSNWQIDDTADSGGSPKDLSITIAAGGYYKYDLGSGFLNNSGDQLRLLDSSGSVVDEVFYSHSNKGVSWIKSGGSWCEAENPTPGSENSSCQSSTDFGSSPTSTPTLTLTPAVTKTPTPTPKNSPTLTPTPGGEVLGTSEETYLLESPTPTPEVSENKGSGENLPKIFLVSGAIFLFSGGLWLWYTLMGKGMADQRNEKSKELN